MPQAESVSAEPLSAEEFINGVAPQSAEDFIKGAVPEQSAEDFIASAVPVKEPQGGNSFTPPAQPAISAPPESASNPQEIARKEYEANVEKYKGLSRSGQPMFVEGHPLYRPGITDPAEIKKLQDFRWMQTQAAAQAGDKDSQALVGAVKWADQANRMGMAATMDQFGPPRATDTPDPLGQTVAAVGRNLKGQAGATAGGLVGLGLGAAMAPETGGLSMLVPLITAIAGGGTGGVMQEIATTNFETPDQTMARHDLAATDQRDHAAAIAASNLALVAPFFRPSPTQIVNTAKAVWALRLGKIAAPAEKQALIQTLGAFGIGAGAHVGTSLAYDQPITLKDVLESGAMMATFNKTTALGRALGLPGHVEAAREAQAAGLPRTAAAVSGGDPLATGTPPPRAPAEAPPEVATPPAAPQTAPAVESPASYDFVQPERVQMRPPGSRDVVVEVKVPEFDAAWQKDEGFHLPPGERGQSEVGGRRQRFEEWLQGTGPGEEGLPPRSQRIETPEVGVFPDGRVSFTNGRHRFAVLRDKGVETVKVSMSPESAELARKFGLTVEAEPPVASTTPSIESPTPPAPPVAEPSIPRATKNKTAAFRDSATGEVFDSGVRSIHAMAIGEPFHEWASGRDGIEKGFFNHDTGEYENNPPGNEWYREPMTEKEATIRTVADLLSQRTPEQREAMRGKFEPDIFDEAMRRASGEEPSPEAAAPTDEPPVAMTPAPEPEPANAEPTPPPVPTEPPGAAQPTAPAERGPTTIKNAHTDAERVKRGLPAAFEPLRRTFGRVWDEAMAILDRNPEAARDLVNDLESNPHGLEDYEDALLLHRQVELENAHDDALDALTRAVDDGTGNLEDLRAAEGRALNELQRLYDVDKSAGTATAQGLNARKMLANRNFTLAKMLSEKRAANAGLDPTPEQAAEIVVLQAEIKRLTDLNAEKEKAWKEKDAQAALDHAVKAMVDHVEAEQAPEPPAPAAEPPKKGKLAKVLEALSEKAKEARARIAARRGQFNVGMDPVAILDHAIVGAELIAKGAKTLGRFTVKLVTEFGEYVREHAEPIYAMARQLHAEAMSPRDLPAERQAIRDGIKEALGEGDSLTDLRAYVQKLALNLVRAGINTRDELVATVHADLHSVLPEVTERQAKDLISGYGDFKPLDPEAAKATLRDLKGQLQQIGKLEDMAAGEAPKRTGVQRREVSAVESDLIRQVNEAKNKGGFRVTDPASQLKSAQDAQRARVKTQIRDLSEQIVTGEKRKRGAALEPDESTARLMALRDRLRQTLRDIEGTPEMTPEQRTQAAIAAADRSTAEFERQVEEEDFARKAGKPILSTPEYEAAIARRDAARAERDAFKALDDATLQQKERERTQTLRRQIEVIDEKLKTGDMSTGTRAEPLLTPAQQALVAERDAMLALLNKLRRESTAKPAEERQMESLLKQIDELDRKLSTGDIDPRTRLPVPPLSPEAERQMAIRDALRREILDQRAAARPRLTPEELALKVWKTRALNRMADLQDKINRGDFTIPERKPTPTNPENTRIAYDLERVKQKYYEGLVADRMRQRGPIAKIFGAGIESLNLGRAIQTSYDMSGVLRQGGFVTISHPLRTLHSLPDMFRAAASEANAHALNEALWNRPNGSEYRQAKLAMTDSRTQTLQQMEEAYMSRWLKSLVADLGADDWTLKRGLQHVINTPLGLVRASERAYTYILNRMRADSYDALKKTLGMSRDITLEESRAIARFINIATGRPSLGSTFDKAAPAMNAVFFAPKYVASRFMLLADPLSGFSVSGGTGRVRAAVAGEYARYLAGMGLIYGLYQFATGRKVETDPRSADFGKLRFGNTRVDPLSGIAQITTLLAREGTQSTVNSKGDSRTLHDAGKDAPKDERVRYGSSDAALEMWRFTRTKFAPAIGKMVDVLSGKDVVGNPVNWKQALATLAVPLSFGDIAAGMKEQGVVGGTALGLIAILGAGVQNYADKTKPEKKPPAKRPPSWMKARP